jgi:hypothetical protein
MQEEQSIQQLQEQLATALEIIETLQRQAAAVHISYAILERVTNQLGDLIKSRPYIVYGE